MEHSWGRPRTEIFEAVEFDVEGLLTAVVEGEDLRCLVLCPPRAW